MKQKRSLAQVFLKDQKYIERILASLDVDNEVVLEIGSGPGDISEAIARRAKSFFCLEIDPRFCEHLRKRLERYSNTQVIEIDALRFDFSRLSEKAVVFGNIPYQVSSKLIDRLVQYRKLVKRVYLTVQKEFAEKLLAGESLPQYGTISCLVQYYAKVKKIFDIPAGSFKPQPKVNSTFIKLEFYHNLPQPARDEKLLFRLIDRAFSQRRKKIINSLPQEARAAFSSLGIRPDLRAENLSLKEYIAIADKVYFLTKK
ncbi:MAG: ribosomal RNA small subunit methyltransferase A [Candidatus Omnitrophica bacterium]|nr:ribosomal RNA small subunit methyltransferase A [Candidatus Omnitrophota bacterium]MBU2473190.1 ribosomal RNA small subunit methyltransferase A [Candidatus Omnitrophota bacterium]